MDVANIAILRGFFPVTNQQRVRVLTLLQEFEYDASSIAADDGITVVKPNLNPGRWLRDPAPVPTWTAKTDIAPVRCPSLTALSRISAYWTA